MMVPRQSFSDKSTNVRLEIGALQEGSGRRDDVHRIQWIWGGYPTPRDGARADRPVSRQTAHHADRLERWVAGLLTVIAAVYGIALLARVVAMYG